LFNKIVNKIIFFQNLSWVADQEAFPTGI